MKIGLPFLDQVRAAGGPEGGWNAETLQSFVAQIVAAWQKEHTADDGHSTIHATGNLYERNRTVAIGDWTAQPFLASDYQGSGAMTWTVTTGTFGHLRYMRIGSTLFIDFKIATSVLGGTADTGLRLTIPASLQAASDYNASLHYLNGATSGGGKISVMAGDTYLTLTKADASNWTVASTVDVEGQIAIEVASTVSAISLASPVLTWSGTTSGAYNLLAVSTIVWAPGTYSITVNRTCTLTFYGTAGGGGGSTSDSNGAAAFDGGGGGGGGEVIFAGSTVVLTNGKTYTLIVGAKGVGGASGTISDGTDGTNTTLVNTTDTITLIALTKGNKGTQAGGAGGAGGTGGTGSNRIAGGAGGTGGTGGPGTATAGGNAANGAGGGGGGGCADSSGGASAGGAGGNGSVAGGAAGAANNPGVNSTGNAGAAGSAGAGNKGGGGGGGGGSSIPGTSTQYGAGGGGGGSEDLNGGATGQGNGAGGNGADGVAVLTFLSAP